MRVKKNWYVYLLLVFCVAQVANAQSDQDEYLQVILKRSEKIVSELDISDSVQFYRVRDAVATQYATINAHHEEREQEIKKLKAEYGDKEEVLDEKRVAYEATEDAALHEIHKAYIDTLDNLLEPEQVEKIKDGMTYSVLPKTYQAYQDMIPRLTAEQKEKILGWLTEARELAMDAPGSKEKHDVFGKFKGRINNYLSGEGYDLNEEQKKWAERRKQ